MKNIENLTANSTPIDMARIVDGRYESPDEVPYSRLNVKGFADVSELASGFCEGVVDSATGAIEFLATKESVNKTLGAAADAIDTAAVYYGDKFRTNGWNQVASDAHTASLAISKALLDYGKQDFRERGKILGHAAFGFALAEVLPLARSTKAGPKAWASEVSEAECLIEPRRMFVSGKERFPLVVPTGTSPSEAFVETVGNAVDDLLPHQRSFLQTNEVSVEVVHRLNEVMQNPGPEVVGVYMSGEGRIVIPEQFLTRENIWVQNRQVERTLKHELGHAFDHKSGQLSKWLSDAPEVREAFEADLKKLNPAQRQFFGRFAMNNGERCRRETFAEAYAYEHGAPAKGETRQAFMECFANTCQKVREIAAKK